MTDDNTTGEEFTVQSTEDTETAAPQEEVPQDAVDEPAAAAVDEVAEPSEEAAAAEPSSEAPAAMQDEAEAESTTTATESTTAHAASTPLPSTDEDTPMQEPAESVEEDAAPQEEEAPLPPPPSPVKVVVKPVAAKTTAAAAAAPVVAKPAVKPVAPAPTPAVKLAPAKTPAPTPAIKAAVAKPPPTPVAAKAPVTPASKPAPVKPTLAPPAVVPSPSAKGKAAPVVPVVKPVVAPAVKLAPAKPASKATAKAPIVKTLAPVKKPTPTIVAEPPSEDDKVHELPAPVTNGKGTKRKPDAADTPTSNKAQAIAKPVVAADKKPEKKHVDFSKIEFHRVLVQPDEDGQTKLGSHVYDYTSKDDVGTIVFSAPPIKDWSGNPEDFHIVVKDLTASEHGKNKTRERRSFVGGKAGLLGFTRSLFLSPVQEDGMFLGVLATPSLAALLFDLFDKDVDEDGDDGKGKMKSPILHFNRFLGRPLIEDEEFFRFAGLEYTDTVMPQHGHPRCKGWDFLEARSKEHFDADKRVMISSYFDVTPPAE